MIGFEIRSHKLKQQQLLMSDSNIIKVRIKAITRETDLINSYDLRPVDGGELPAFKAGSHIDLHLAIGLLRSYSLMNAENERHRYVVGVARDRNSRGGSRFVLDKLSVGDVLDISPPRNLFPLYEEAPHSILIGGGIGVTPMVSMAQRLNDLGKSWTLHYAARSRADAAFVDALTVFDNVKIHCDDEQGGVLDITSIVDAAPAGAHLYCCGPAPMMSAFANATRDMDPNNIHVEFFSPIEEAAIEGGFLVELARSGKTLAVPAGSTILETLVNAGLSPVASCQQGICGSCQTVVLEGEPDHRDLVLTPEEQASNTTMMICCSGSKGKKLVLDL